VIDALDGIGRALQLIGSVARSRAGATSCSFLAQKKPTRRSVNPVQGVFKPHALPRDRPTRSACTRGRSFRSRSASGPSEQPGGHRRDADRRRQACPASTSRHMSDPRPERAPSSSKPLHDPPATADAEGPRGWTPVWFAPATTRVLLGIVAATRELAQPGGRSQVRSWVFDYPVPSAQRRPVYMTAGSRRS